jgi:glycosyltransferase involved in cell wall biosynthesis
MRIALVLPGFSAHADDWAIPALLNLARSLAQQHQVYIFSQRYPGSGLYQFDHLTHHALGGGQQFGLTSAKIWLQTSQAIIRRHRQTPFDLIHAFWADEAGFSAALAGRWLKLPLIVSIGGGELTNLPDINYGAQRFLIRRLTTYYALSQAKLVTAGSAYQLDLCRAHRIPESKLRLAPLGVDTSLFQPISLVSPYVKPSIVNRQSKIENPTLVQAASLLPVKNQALLLEVFSLVKVQIPHIRLQLAGSGPLQASLQQLAKKLQVEANLTWQQLSYPQMPAFYQRAHLYLQSSRHESQGMAVLEAMACGLPVIGTPVGVAAELTCLPAQYSAEALAGQVVEILNDEARYQEMRRRASQTVTTNYSLPVTTANFLRLYTEAKK